MKRRAIALIAAMIFVVTSVAAVQVEGIFWRLQLLGLQLTGNLSGLTTAELVPMLHPTSKFWLKPLIDKRNAYAVVKNPYKSNADIAAGREMYLQQCAQCHSPDAHGAAAPGLFGGALEHGDSELALFRVLRDGIPGTAMLASDFDDREAWQVVAYLTSRRVPVRSSLRTASAPQISLPFERLVRAAEEPHNWLSYSGTYDGMRHSRLEQLDATSISRLSLRWVMQVQRAGKIEASPIVVDGVMFLTLPDSVVVALDASTGAEYWRWAPRLESDLRLCCGNVNRGVAVLDDSVYVGTLDNRLVSLDAASGQVRWERQLARPEDGYSITAAPLALDRQIVIGVSGGEYAIRGFLDSYDAASGERNWRFYTTPEQDASGGDTWAGDSWRTGGGPTWMTGSFDPSTGLLYWGVGNPSPDFDGSKRQGDNLYTNSLVALDSATGDYRWHFQFTPHDVHDRAAAQVPILVGQRAETGQAGRVIQANRNGFFYVLGAQTGQYFGSRPFAEQNWALGIDENGRPAANPDAKPSEKGALVWPGSNGATNWWPHTYDPQLNLLLVPVLNRPSVYFRRGGEELTPGKMYLGGNTIRYAGAVPEKKVIAIDPDNFRIVWEHDIEHGKSSEGFGGMLSTVSGLTFVGEGSRLFALTTKSGEAIWSVDLGGQVGSPPITYAIDGSQHLTISGGESIFTFRVSDN